MDIQISAHAAEQADKRGIDESGIKSVLLNGSTMTLPSRIDPDVVIVLGVHDGRVWAIVLNFITLVVVTVRPASRKERGLYEQYSQG